MYNGRIVCQRDPFGVVMKAAPGRQLPVQDIFGCDAFIAEVWRILDRNSVPREAEHRIGKTSIRHKMDAEPLPGWEPVSLDLEKVHSAAEFADQVCLKVRERLSFWRRQGIRLQAFQESLRGGEVGGLKFS